jgi:hypothetical protein
VSWRLLGVVVPVLGLGLGLGLLLVVAAEGDGEAAGELAAERKVL